MAGENNQSTESDIHLDSDNRDSGKVGSKNDLLNSISQGNRRKVSDRRSRESGTPKSTVERRLEEDRRIEKENLNKAKDQIARHQAELKLQQHRKKILLAGCEPVMGLNYDYLAMDDYPDNTLVAEARRDRDYWVAICACFAMLFMFSVLGLLDPWLGGVGAGLSFVSAMFAFSPARKIFFSRPHLHELLAKRKVIEYSALHHIQYLEGMDGLAWRCHKLTKFNSNLDNKLFHGLYRYSKEKSLLDYIQSKKTIRLYLLMATEAQKAYKRLEKEYLESHFLHLDQGWDDRIDEVEAIKIEQSLKDGENESAEDVNS